MPSFSYVFILYKYKFLDDRIALYLKYLET